METDEEIKKSMEETKTKFIENLDKSKFTRHRVFKQVYKMQKADKQLPSGMSWGMFKKSVENDWETFTKKDKDDFFNLWVGDVQSEGSIEDMKFIMGSLKSNSFNIAKVFSDLKMYGAEKKMRKQKDE